MQLVRAIGVSILLVFCASLISACNTVDGAGQDFKAAGQAVSDSAQKVKRKINEE